MERKSLPQPWDGLQQGQLLLGSGRLPLLLAAHRCSLPLIWLPFAAAQPQIQELQKDVVQL